MQADKTPSPVYFEMLILHFAGDASSNYPIGSAVEVSIDASHCKASVLVSLAMLRLLTGEPTVASHTNICTTATQS